MTGEMSESEVTRENFPVHFAAADKVAGATVEPWDYYQGPYILVPGKGHYFLCSDTEWREAYWYNIADDRVSSIADDDDLPDAFRDLVEHGGYKLNENKPEPQVVVALLLDQTQYLLKLLAERQDEMALVIKDQLEQSLAQAVEE